MLTIVEARVLGALLEKERTTPDQYPLTLNALITACNQATSRDPVMVLDAHEVEATIDGLKVQKLARMVHPSHGRSVTRFRQVIDEVRGWTPAQASLMTLLLLRGPQTISELRTRSERMHEFESLDEVESVLRELAALDEPQVVRLERQIGQKELRWQQLIAEEAEQAPRRHVVERMSGGSSSGGGGGMTERVIELEAQNAALEERVAKLEAALQDLL